jgi:ribosomal protein S18 acetylase RimI-like enzyme
MSTASSRRAEPPSAPQGSPAEPVAAATPPASSPTATTSATVVAWPGRTNGVQAAALPSARPLPDAAVRIETAQLSDWMDILDVVARHFPYAEELELRYYLCNQSSWFHIARVGDALGGFVHLQPRLDERTMWLNMIVVDEPYRRFGCARRLLAHAEEVARQAGCESIGLRVMASNERAIRLYLEQGYEDIRETYDEDAGGRYRVMSKPLAASTGAVAGAEGLALDSDTGWRRWRNQLNYLVRIGSRSPLRGR